MFVQRPAELRKDMLNRARLQSIAGVQVYVPIPFVHFHPSVAHEGGKRHFSVRSGRFDGQRMDFVSFHVADYVSGKG
jgi:hypothetical protein